MKKNNVIIIAEIGVNHNNNIIIAKKLISSAKSCGADFVKFQSYKTENLIIENTPLADYQKKNIKKKTNQFNLLKKMEISKKFHNLIIAYCKRKKIQFLSSPFDLESLDFLFKKKIFNIKIASGEITNYPLLKIIGKKAKKIFLSTGMSSMQEISNALNLLIKNGAAKKNIYILHCHSDYPTKLSDVNLLAMNEIKKKFNLKIGYSDHTEGFETSVAAVAMGASVIEKHITLSKKMIGPDHIASMEPKEFKTYIRLIRNTEILMGKKIKKPTRIEIINKKIVRKSIVAIKEIKKGEIFNQYNLGCKRPAKGISPILWDRIMGRKSKKNYKINQYIKI